MLCIGGGWLFPPLQGALLRVREKGWGEWVRHRAIALPRLHMFLMSAAV